MNLLASMMVGQGEADRYLPIVIRALAEFCDGLCVVDESTDEATNYALTSEFVVSHQRAAPGSFFRHEGRARQLLLETTLEQRPTHILALDADELVTDGRLVRDACESDRGIGIWTLGINECWKVDAGSLWIRSDGGWDLQARAPILYRAPRRAGGLWRIQDRALACGREPLAVRQLAGRAVRLDADVIHMGWANEAERRARYQRYVKHDGGRFHSRAHLNSIMFPDSRVRLARREWPEGLASYKDALVERANR